MVLDSREQAGSRDTPASAPCEHTPVFERLRVVAPCQSEGSYPSPPAAVLLAARLFPYGIGSTLTPPPALPCPALSCPARVTGVPTNRRAHQTTHRPNPAPRRPHTCRSLCVHTGTTVVLSGVLSANSGTPARRAVRFRPVMTSLRSDTLKKSMPYACICVNVSHGTAVVGAWICGAGRGARHDESEGCDVETEQRCTVTPYR